MKTYNKTPFFILIVLLAIGFTACNKDNDLTAPEVTEFLINDASTDIEVTAGTDMHVDLQFTDDVELREYKIDIHDDFDGHSHGKTDATIWSYLEIVALSGKQATEHKDIEIPSDAAAGPYHFNLRVLDDAGNEGEIKILDFLVTNATQAAINVTSPDFSTEYAMAIGDTLMLAGTITDDVDIAEIMIAIEEHAHDHSGKTNSGWYEEDRDLDGTADTSWDFSTLVTDSKQIIVPSTAELGEYELIITVKDSDDNMTIWEAEIHVE